MKLLTRDQFKIQVFKRDKDKCVECSKPAVDAHHLLERKLFPDGGYYLENGVSLCADCHYRAEDTSLSVEHLRLRAKIPNKKSPLGFSENKTYDKWGNELIEGVRILGPMRDDTGMRKILKL